MSTSDDRKLLGLLDSLSPEHLARLKTLTDARTAVPPGPPTDGPETYLGVTVPGGLRPNWDQPEAHWWRGGVKDALESAAPCCGHPVDEHSVYGCLDSCSCEKRPDLRNKDAGRADG